MIWNSDEARLALLELLTRDVLKRRRVQHEAYEVLEALPWTRATGRRDEIGVVEARRSELSELIDRIWPAWRQVHAELVAAGLNPTPVDYGKLLDRQRAAELSTLPDRLNRRTAASLTATHSKVALTEPRRAVLEGTQLTHDGAIRLRPPSGLMARTIAGAIDLSVVATVLGEVSIPERAFLDGLRFEGKIGALLLVENLGAWRDLVAPPGWLVAHVPGWDTATVGCLLDRFKEVPVIHFGDLDPNGVRIFKHLRQRAPHLRWFLPDFWFETVETAGLATDWPAELDLSFAPAKVQDLAARGLWLEQERIVVDPRFETALEAAAL